MNVRTAHLFIQWALLTFVIIGFVFLLGLALAVRNVALIVSHPLVFAVELVLMSLVPGIPILYFVISRKISIKTAWKWVIALSTKFGILHVLFQTSGFYDFLLKA